MERKFKSLAKRIICIALVASLVFLLMTPSNWIRWPPIPRPPDDVSLVYGIPNGPSDIDPQYANDEISFSVIDQVCEGLFKYNLSDSNFAIIPNLALSGVWSPDEKEYMVTLRQGVTFHDGAPFNADAVIFTWERLAWALNTTGTNTDRVTQVAELYGFPNGTPIVKDVIKNSNYSVTFVLNDRFAPFKALLCFSASYILSPESTPATAYIDTYTGTIIGTGPFFYDIYEAGVEIVLPRYTNYWKGKSQIELIVYSIITDANARNAALLSGDIDYLSNPMDEILGVLNLTEGINLVYVGQGLVTQYLGMNNVLLNSTWRETISYAIDYDYILNVLREGNAVRMESPIPEGILYANWTFDEAELDVPYARAIMQGMGFGVGWNVTIGSINEPDWEGATFATFNYTYNIGNDFREDVLVLLQDNLGKIGIVVEEAGMTWEEFTNRLYEREGRHRNMLQLYTLEWGFVYSDPSTYINPLFTNRSAASNFVQYNGYQAAIEKGRNPFNLWDNVQLLMEEALRTTNEELRKQYYWRIQELLIEQDRPWAFLYARRVYSARVSNLEGCIPNTIGKEWFWPCYYS